MYEFIESFKSVNTQLSNYNIKIGANSPKVDSMLISYHDEKLRTLKTDS